MADVKITIKKDGPLLVDGDALIEDHEGNPIPKKKRVVALCRCGGSKKKPFCDGTHSKIGFAGAEAAVATFDREQSRDG